MSSDKRNIIHLLPDNVASQIAAGEVVQRPSSVVKELVENSIDAGATNIQIILKDSGRTLIQVIDNGKGMSAEDAIVAFKRHATSKIKQADDLFNLSTMGFRGEALYSIAAVAEVEMKTRQEDDELGTRVVFSGGELQSQEPVACDKGCNISVRYLFFNVPARRKFLKSNDTELRNVITCIEQIAAYYNDISFSLSNNGKQLYQLSAENRIHRIVSLLGKKLGSQLLPVEADTSLVKFSGYVGNIEAAHKRAGRQFFFVNGRFIQHPYFNRAVSMAYEKILPSDYRPAYFIFFEVDPAKIDVNIHPAKTEVKFEDEQSIFPIITAAVREALNKANIMPGMDFDGADINLFPPINDLPDFTPEPSIQFDPGYDPFKSVSNFGFEHRNDTRGWDKLFDQHSLEEPAPASYTPAQDVESNDRFLLDDRFMVVKAPDGLNIANLYRATFQVAYEQYLYAIENGAPMENSLLFPEVLEFSPKEDIAFSQIKPTLERMGFKFEPFGKHAYQICSVPVSAEKFETASLIVDFVNSDDFERILAQPHEKIAEKLARSAAQAVNSYNMYTANELLDKLSRCKSPVFTNYGKAIWIKIGIDEISRFFTR